MQLRPKSEEEENDKRNHKNGPRFVIVAVAALKPWRRKVVAANQ